MGKLLEVDGERAAGKCHHPRGTEKYYFVICFSVDTSTPELASMESTCFASVTGVAFAANAGREKERQRGSERTGQPLTPRRCNLVEIAHVKRRREDRLRPPSSTDVYLRVSRCASLLAPRDDDPPINVTEKHVSFRNETGRTVD